MALQAEIDALLAAAEAQGLVADGIVDMSAVLVQVTQRFGQTIYPDEFVPIPGGPSAFNHTYGGGTIGYVRDFLADVTTTMTFEQIWGRAWGEAMENDLSNLIHFALQMIRVLGRDNRFNTSLPRFASKSVKNLGIAYFTF